MIRADTIGSERLGFDSEAATYPDTNAGRPVGIREFIGKVVVVNLWATWYSPCVREMPSLQGLHEQFHLQDTASRIDDSRRLLPKRGTLPGVRHRAFARLLSESVLCWRAAAAGSSVANRRDDLPYRLDRTEDRGDHNHDHRGDAHSQNVIQHGRLERTF